MTDLAQIFVCVVVLAAMYSLGHLMGRGHRLSTVGPSKRASAFLRDDEQARKNWYEAMVKNGMYQVGSSSTSSGDEK